MDALKKKEGIDLKDNEKEKKTKKKRKTGKTISFLVYLLLGVIAAVCIFHILNDKIAEADNEAIYETLREAAEEVAIETSGENVSPYRDLYAENSDMVGWIHIDGTTIDYPVMQSETRDYYLNHNFYKEYSVYGVPYTPIECDVTKPSDNIIIYGHHIKGGRMFSALDSYKSESFYKEYKYINFDTKTYAGVYEIIAVFKTTVYDSTGFKYYTFVDAETEDDFYEYVETCKKLSLYDCDADAEYGDKLITLSTCEYSRKNSRLVVVAKMITKTEYVTDDETSETEE